MLKGKLFPFIPMLCYFLNVTATILEKERNVIFWLLFAATLQKYVIIIERFIIIQKFYQNNPFLGQTSLLENIGTNNLLTAFAIRRIIWKWVSLLKSRQYYCYKSQCCREYKCVGKSLFSRNWIVRDGKFLGIMC